MENKELMEQIHASLEKQNHYAKWQLIFTIALVVCCIGLALMVFDLLPKVQALIPQVESLTQQIEVTLTDLQGITKQLAEADLKGMVDNVDQLVGSSQTGRADHGKNELHRLDYSQQSHQRSRRCH